MSYTDPFGLSPLNGLFMGTGLVHSILGWLGCIPGLFGAGANLADALIYGFVDHDYGMAALSGACALTGGAGSIARMAAAGGRLQRGAMYVAKASELVTNTAIAVRSGMGIATTGYGMYQKYVVDEEKMGWDTAGECAAILLNGLALGTSAVNLTASAQTLGKMLKEDNVSGKLASAVKSGINTVKSGAQTLWADNRGGVLVGASSSIETPINSGTSKPRDTATPNSIYEQINPDGTVKSRAFYEQNGNQFSRQDFDHPHFDKKTQQYYQPHEHNYFYNENGQCNGKSDGPLPSGYNNQPTK